MKHQIWQIIFLHNRQLKQKYVTKNNHKKIQKRSIKQKMINDSENRLMIVVAVTVT